MLLLLLLMLLLLMLLLLMLLLLLLLLLLMLLLLLLLLMLLLLMLLMLLTVTTFSTLLLKSASKLVLNSKLPAASGWIFLTRKKLIEGEEVNMWRLERGINGTSWRGHSTHVSADAAKTRARNVTRWIGDPLWRIVAPVVS
jgi:hypothetical protein